MCAASRGDLFEQRRGLGGVGVFAAGEREADGVAKRIDEAADLGAEPATRAAQSLWAVFFLAPAAC